MKKSPRGSCGSATAVTSCTSTSSASDFTEDAIGVGITLNGRRFQRSLTDDDYNLFLDFLEESSVCTTPNEGSRTEPIADEERGYLLFLDFLEESSICSTPNKESITEPIADEERDYLSYSGIPSNRDIIPNLDDEEDIEEVPSIIRSHPNNEDPIFDLSLLDIEHTLGYRNANHHSALEFDETNMNSRAEIQSSMSRGVILSRSKSCHAIAPTMTRSTSHHSISSSMALGALAALLGTNSPNSKSPFQVKEKKKKCEIRNLWADDDDLDNDDDIISLPDSDFLFIDD